MPRSAVVLVLAAALGCHRSPARGATASGSQPLSPAWVELDLPLYGGKTSLSDPNHLVVTYPGEAPAAANGHLTAYTGALKAAGWEETRHVGGPLKAAGDQVQVGYDAWSGGTHDGFGTLQVKAADAGTEVGLTWLLRH